MVTSTTNATLFPSADGDCRCEQKAAQSVSNTQSFYSFFGEQLRCLRVGWATRGIVRQFQDSTSEYSIDTSASSLGSGDLIIARVKSIGSHSALITSDAKRLRLYLDDVILGVTGSRYASDAYEAKITHDGQLHLVTASGMCATVLNRHSDQGDPTDLELLGRVCNAGRPINLIESCFAPRTPGSAKVNVVFVLGSGMNAGKTTTSRRLVKALLRNGLRVAASKLTGSVSHRDLYEYESTGAHDVRDFSQYGFPSTYGCSLNELEQLFLTMVADAEQARPDVIVMEIADGVLQKETAAILNSSVCRPLVFGTVLAAPCALSSLQGVHQITKHGHTVLAVSGLISNSPLMIREFEECCDVPFATSCGHAAELAERVTSALANRSQPVCRSLLSIAD
jgi:hypothetical protein